MSDLRLRVLQPLQDRGRREPGEDRHLHGADVRARVRRDRGGRRHGHEDRHAVAGLDAERDERLGEPRHLRRELGERPFAPVAVLAAEDGGRRVRRALAPSRGRTPAATLSRPPTNHFAHSGPSDASSTCSQGCENSMPRSSTTSGQNLSGSSTEQRVQLVVIRTAEPARQARHVRLLDELSTG